MPSIRPDPLLVTLSGETERQRAYGILRSRQRAARHVIEVLRELQDIITRSGKIEVTFIDREAVEIKVTQTVFSESMLNECSKKGQE